MHYNTNSRVSRPRLITIKYAIKEHSAKLSEYLEAGQHELIVSQFQSLFQWKLLCEIIDGDTIICNFKVFQSLFQWKLLCETEMILEIGPDEFKFQSLFQWKLLCEITHQLSGIQRELSFLRSFRLVPFGQNNNLFILKV